MYIKQVNIRAENSMSRFENATWHANSGFSVHKRLQSRTLNAWVSLEWITDAFWMHFRLQNALKTILDSQNAISRRENFDLADAIPQKRQRMDPTVAVREQWLFFEFRFGEQCDSGPVEPLMRT